jgi:RNA-binding protein YhbY
MISEGGLTAGVIAEIERSLKSHGLIKIRVFGIEREAREMLLSEVCAKTGALSVQHIGKVLVIYRKQPDAPAKATVRRRRAVPRRASPAQADRPRTRFASAAETRSKRKIPARNRASR